VLSLVVKIWEIHWNFCP